MNTRTIINRSVRLAQQKYIPHIGDTVAVPYRPLAAMLIEIRGQTATIDDTQEKVEVPLQDLFSPDQAKDIALTMKQNLN